VGDGCIETADGAARQSDDPQWERPHRVAGTTTPLQPTQRPGEIHRLDKASRNHANQVIARVGARD
jgi:hypothetical protein